MICRAPSIGALLCGLMLLRSRSGVALLAGPSAQISQQILSSSDLRTWLGGAQEPVTIRGVVTRTGHETFVQDVTGGVLVQFAEQPRIKVGDELEVSGLPRAGLYSSRIEHATGRFLWAANPPPPAAVTVNQAARGDFDGEYIELEARLDHVEASPGNLLVLTLSTEDQSFLALLQTAKGGFISPHFEPHSILRLRGVCSMDAGLTRNAVPFVLLLRSAEDAEELAGPPWWSPQLLLRDALILLSLSLLSALIMVRVRSNRNRAVQQEREHIAHEIHDTLAQSFAGVAFQLHAVRSGLPHDARELSGHVDVAINMVRHSHQEARRSIAALRTRTSSKDPLATELRRAAERMLGTGPMEMELTIQGSPRPLSLRVHNALLRIGQEAAANAIHHSGASMLTIVLVYLEKAVRLEVRDNGCGLQANGEIGKGFGLAGMSSRAHKLQGTLTIKTETACGTTVCATIPTETHSIWYSRFRNASWLS